MTGKLLGRDGGGRVVNGQKTGLNERGSMERVSSDWHCHCRVLLLIS